MRDRHLKVQGIQYKIVDESWTDHAAEVDHIKFVVYKRTGDGWDRLNPPSCYQIDYAEAESSIPGLYVDKQCPTCGDWKTVRADDVSEWVE